MLEPHGDGVRRGLDGMKPARRRPAPAARPVVIAPEPAAQSEPMEHELPVTLAAAPPVAEAMPAPIEASASPAAGRVVRQRSTGQRRRRGLILSAIGLPVVAIIAAAGWVFWPRGDNEKLSAANLAASVVKSSVGDKATLKGQAEGRTNVVIYGMTKDGLRTDSIMLASYYWKEKKLATINIPRDLQVNDGFETVKFGEVYAYAIKRKPKDKSYPSQAVADLVAKEYGVPVDYWVRLNMRGEVDLIDTLGGVDVTVENAFTDYRYPKWDYSGYISPAPSFVAGLQHMTGDRALIYSRSRHSLDANEGSDFARSKRQMIVLGAVMTRVKQLGIVGNLADIGKYLKILGANVDTNMTTDEMVAFVTPAKALDPAADLVRGNWAVGNGFLCSSTSSVGAYITLYGVPGSCTSSAGGQTSSKYRELARYYAQNLLTAAPQESAAFVAATLPQLPGSYAAAPSSPSVLSAQATPTPVPAAAR